MNDEPLIRLLSRKSKDISNEDRRKYSGVLRSILRLVQISKRGQKGRGEHIRVNRNVATLPLGNKPHSEKPPQDLADPRHSGQVRMRSGWPTPRANSLSYCLASYVSRRKLRLLWGRPPALQIVQNFLNAGDAQCPWYLNEADSMSGSPARALSDLFSRAITLEQFLACLCGPQRNGEVNNAN
jgi:hypothetical protein